MIAFRLKSVQARLFGIVIAVALPLAIVMAVLWWQSLQSGRALEVALLESRVALIEQNLRDLTKQSEWVLSRMAARPDFREMRPTACDDEMARLRDVNPAFLAITLWDTAGSLVCSSYPPNPGEPVPQPHRKSFDEGLASKGLYLSNVFQGRISGMYVVSFTFPVKNAAGATVGLLSLPVRMDYFDKLLLDVVERTGKAAGIVDRDSVLVARVPGEAQWRGKRVDGLPGVSEALAKPEGHFMTTGIDGIARIFAQKAVPGIGWHAYVGVEEGVLFAGFRDQLVQGCIMFAIVVILSLALAYLIGRGISRPLIELAAVADVIAEGDHDRRVQLSGGGEIARVAQHLNSMIDALVRAESSLKKSNKRLYELSGRLLRAEEDERRRISRELHDEVGQSLTAMTLDLHLIARRNAAGADAEAVRRCQETVANVLQQVRDLSRLLRPPQLERRGLWAAIKEHAERNVAEFGVRVHCSDPIDDAALDPGLQTACFRVAQEALTNVMRHARASNVWIGLGSDQGWLTLSVRDNGVGFDASRAMEGSADSRSAGVSNMRDRVELANGTLQIHSSPGAGTEIIARFPLNPALHPTR